MPWSLFFECWVFSQLFHSPLWPSSRGSLVPLNFLPLGGDLGLIPGLERSPGEGKGYPLQYSGLESSMDCIAHGVAKSWTQLSNFLFHFHLPIWGYWSFSWQSEFQLALHPTQHFTWYTLHMSEISRWQYTALTYSFPNLEPVRCSMSGSNVSSWPSCLRRQVRWSGVPISLRIFHSLLWSTPSKALV